MINNNNHIKCTKCGTYNVCDKFIRCNSVDKISYKQSNTGEFIGFETYINRPDKYNLICQNCKFEADIEAFETDKYRLDENNNFMLVNRHYFKCNCNEVYIEDMCSMAIIDDTEYVFQCEKCNCTFSRDELNSRIRYLSPSEIKNDIKVKTAFEKLNKNYLLNFGEILTWDNVKSDWIFVHKKTL